AKFSIRGDNIGICAPGVDIMAAEPESRYAKVDGTSPATAIVSGAAALVRAKFPDLSAADVIHRLTATADDNGPPGRDDQCGFGVLNIVKALTADVPPLNSADATASVTPSAAAPGATTPTAAGPATTPVAAPETEPASSNTTLIVGALGGLVVVGGLVAFLLLRRRRAS
ncbi:MAG: S8 family serine peptidase, partial [Actinoplanes sp.]